MQKMEQSIDRDHYISSHYKKDNDPLWLGDEVMPTRINDGYYVISVIKYVTRHQKKGGRQDLEKARDILVNRMNAKNYENIDDEPKFIDLGEYGHSQWLLFLFIK